MQIPCDGKNSRAWAACSRVERDVIIRITFGEGGCPGVSANHECARLAAGQPSQLSTRVPKRPSGRPALMDQPHSTLTQTHQQTSAKLPKFLGCFTARTRRHNLHVSTYQDARSREPPPARDVSATRHQISLHLQMMFLQVEPALLS